MCQLSADLYVQLSTADSTVQNEDTKDCNLFVFIWAPSVFHKWDYYLGETWCRQVFSPHIFFKCGFNSENIKYVTRI